MTTTNTNANNIIAAMTSVDGDEEVDVDEVIASSRSLRNMLTTFETNMEEAIEDFRREEQGTTTTPQQQQSRGSSRRRENFGGEEVDDADVERPGLHPTNISDDVASSIDIDNDSVVDDDQDGLMLELEEANNIGNAAALDDDINPPIQRRKTRRHTTKKKGNNRRRRSTIAQMIDKIPDYNAPADGGDGDENDNPNTTSPPNNIPIQINQQLIQQRHKTICGHALLGGNAGCLILILLVLCVVIAVVLGALFGFNDGSDGTESYDPIFGITGYIETAAPSAEPTNAPTLATQSPSSTPTIEFPIDILPLATKETILFQKSPQAKAWAWLQDDLKEASNHVDSLERYTTRFVLAVLFFSTGGPTSWNTNTGWLNHSIHECQWYMPKSDWYDTEEGSCPDGSSLKHLELHRNNLNGTIPPQLALLSTTSSSLITLALHENPLLGGSIPSQLGSMTQLQVLRLWSSQLTGNIPTQLGQLTNLLALEIDDNVLTGTIPLELFTSGMASLEKLHLFKNQLIGTIHTQIGLLTNMGNLRMDSNRLEGKIPTQLASMTNLYRIKFENNQLTGNIPTEIGTRLSLLQEIKLDRNLLNGNYLPTQFGLLTLLEELRLYQNPFGQGAGEGGGGVTIPSEFGLMTKLMDLRLDDDQLTGSIPSQLGQLTLLTNLRLGNNDGLSGTIASELGQLTMLQNLQLQDLSLTGRIPSQLGKLQNIINLDLSNNNLEGSIPFQVLLVNNDDNDDTTTATTTPTMHKWMNRFNLIGNPNLSGQVTDTFCTAQQQRQITTSAATNGVVLSLNCSSVSCNCCNCEV